VAIPYSSILDVEKSNALDFSETIEVKVVDKGDNFATVDSYFFAYFKDLPAALDQIRDAVRSYRAVTEEALEMQVVDTTVPRSVLHAASAEKAAQEHAHRLSSVFRFPSLWRPSNEPASSPSNRTVPIPEPTEPVDNGEDFTHITRNKSSFVPMSSSPESGSPLALVSSELSDSPTHRSSHSPTPTPSTDHTYPPATSSLDSSNALLSPWGKPSWLKIPSRRAFSGSSSSGVDHSSTVGSGITEALTSALFSTGSRLVPELGFSILDLPGSQIDPEVQDKFRTAFAFDDKEQLLGCKISTSVGTNELINALNRFPWISSANPSCLRPVVHFEQLLLFQV
jgi:sterol 3beta-glucosyltransferase